jgi:hypothetical protein
MELYEKHGLKHAQVLEGVISNSFETIQEAGAFDRALIQAFFYTSCNIKAVRADSKTSQIAFIGKNTESNSEYTRVRHSSPEERIAFELGIKAGEGSMGRRNLSHDDVRNYQQALAALVAAGLGNTPQNLVQFIK